MRRTIHNLEFVERHADRQDGPFEVTQLVNSVLGVLIHPWERRTSEAIEIDADLVGWPMLSNQHADHPKAPRTRAQLVTCLRHAFAHGNITLIEDGRRNISAIRVWNTPYRETKRNWETTIDVATLRDMLFAFAEIAERSYQLARAGTSRSAAD